MCANWPISRPTRSEKRSSWCASGSRRTSTKCSGCCRSDTHPPAKETAMSTRHWHASYGSIPKEINPDAYRSVVDLMEQAMVRFADRPAFRCAGQTLSYAQVDKLSRDFAAYLQTKLGVKKG